MSLRIDRRQALATLAAAGLAVGTRAPGADWAAPDPTSGAHHKLAAAYSAEHRGISVLVMVGGKLVFEDYPNGGAADRAHELASGTKSFAGVAACAAIADGLIQSWDEKLVDTLTEWKDDPLKSQITLRQLLSLTSGIGGGGIARPPSFADAIKEAATADPGTKFMYGPAPYQTFGEFLRRKLAPKNEGVLDYYQRRLFDPIGLKYGGWRKGTDGQPHLPSGAQLSAANWAKFGELARLGGKWEGREIVPQKLLDECFVGTKANPAYGLTWWLNRPVDAVTLRAIPLMRIAQDLAGPKSEFLSDLFFAAGAGDQRLYISRKLEVVVVRQATGILAAITGRREGYSDKEFLARLMFGTDANGKKM
ncbi:MAG: serine hydrolase [Pirellulaceae bacterium]|nr:serine hydrolase [Pirellulaceae bacterium]